MITAKSETTKTELFISYASQQRKEFIELFIDSYLFQIRDRVNYWWDKDIDNRSSWDSQIQEKLNTSKIIIAFISNDYLSGKKEYIWKEEIPVIIEKFTEKSSIVIPVMVHSGCPYNISEFGKAKIQFFPKGSSLEQEPNINEIFNKLLEEIVETIEDIQTQKDVEYPSQSVEIKNTAKDNHDTIYKVNQTEEEIKNPLFSSIERILKNMANYYFNQNGFKQPMNSYLRSYLTSQKGAFLLIENNFRKIETELEEFISPVKSLSNDLKKRCTQIQTLMTESNCENFPLSKSVSDIIIHIEEVDDNLISLVNNSQLTSKKSIKFNLLIPLANEIKKLQILIDSLIEEAYNPSLN